MTRRLAIDVGSARVGLAISEGTLALPLETLAADTDVVARINDIVRTKDVSVLYVG